MRDIIPCRRGRSFKRSVVLPLLLCCLGAWAESRALEVEHAWAPPTPPGTAVAVVYLRILNKGAIADRLLSVDTPVAARAAVHESRIVGGVMQMRELDGIDCPAGGVLDSEPGGTHLMLMGVKRALNSGSKFPLSLHFRHAGTIVVSVTVQSAQ